MEGNCPKLSAARGSRRAPRRWELRPSISICRSRRFTGPLPDLGDRPDGVQMARGFSKSKFRSPSERDQIQPLKWVVNSPTNQNGTVGFEPWPNLSPLASAENDEDDGNEKKITKHEVVFMATKGCLKMVARHQAAVAVAPSGWSVSGWDLGIDEYSLRPSW